MELSASYHAQIRQRVAILVDGDNHPVGGIPAIEQEASRWGDVTIRRVFGDMALHKGWAEATNFTAMHCPTSAGKNRADIALVIAAMDFAHRQLASVFLIVSDDRDFGPLVNHLREQGYRVEWRGKISKPQKVTPDAKREPVALGESLVDRVKGIVGKDGCLISSLGPAGQKQGIKISDTPQKSWRAWFLAHESVFVCNPRGPNARVHLKT
jgi:hypothetical protein